jgi:hypothetical protein
MPLPELQTRIAAILFGDATAMPPTCIRAGGIAPELRLGIYRNNLEEGFLKTLALEFPVIQRLVGKDYFRQLALRLLFCEPSRSGDLHHVGAPFARFLAEQFADTPYRYFADVAALEWALQECLVAEDDEGVDVRALQDAAPCAYPRLRFALRKAARLLASPFPIVRIWEANQPQAEPAGTIDLAAGAEFALAHRLAGGTRITRLSAGEFALLSTLARAEPLEAALDASLVREPDFDLGIALRRAFELGVFARVSSS